MSTGNQAPKGSSILGKLAEARKASVEATGLVKSGASTDSPALSVKSTFSTGMANTATLAPKNAGVHRLPAIDATRPRKTKTTQVLFRAAKPNLGFHVGNSRIGFTHGWLLTEDARVIEHLRNEKNAAHYSVVEIKEEEKK